MTLPTGLRTGIAGGTRRFILVQLPEALPDDGLSQREARSFCDSLGLPPVLANLSGSPITIARAEDRRLLVRSASFRSNAAYVFAAAGKYNLAGFVEPVEAYQLLRP